MPCPRDVIGSAISKCPFLHQVSASQGEDYARQIAARPSVPASKAGFGPIFEEKACDFEATLRLFHGPAGVVPLKRVAASLANSEQAAPQAPQCSDASSHSNDRSVARRSPISAAPFASINMAAAFSFLVSFATPAMECFCQLLRMLHDVLAPGFSQVALFIAACTTPCRQCIVWQERIRWTKATVWARFWLKQ